VSGALGVDAAFLFIVDPGVREGVDLLLGAFCLSGKEVLVEGILHCELCTGK